MAGLYADDWLESLRARNDLVQVVSQYVTLAQKNRRYWGCCPFHSEKTPSFSVDPDKQFYYCFGCHAGGNVIHFLMNMEKLSFTEAVAQLAERVGMPLPQTADDDEFAKRREQRERLYAALREAALYYHEMLHTDSAKAALDYLKGRGLTHEHIRRFGLGYAPAQWQALTDHLMQKGFTEKELVACGLTTVKNGKHYDFFRDKVMFPIIDQRSRVLGFGGRVLKGDGPKYINTAETQVYNKREMLYGLNFYRSFGTQRELIVVEGYMDLIAVSTAGVKNVVASLGTALTTGQVRLMRRFADTVYIAYDGDAAGRNATLRGLDLLENEGLHVRVLMLPDGMDPDDFVRKRGRDAFFALKSNALSLTEFKLQLLRDQCDLSGEEGRMHFAQQAVALLKDAGPVERERYIKFIAKLSGFSIEALMQESGKQAKQTVRIEPEPKQRASPGDDEIEQRILCLMATDPRVRAQAYLFMDVEDFADPLYSSMYLTMENMHQEDCTAALLSNYSDPKEAALAAEVLTRQESATDRMVLDYMDRLRLKRYEREVDELNHKSKQSGADMSRIAAEIQKRTMEMDSLRNKRVSVASTAPLAKGELK